MARMRTIKPEACTSESLAEVPRAVRWTFACLWTHCDDEGRAVRNTRLIKAAIYPLDDEMTPAMVGSDLEELERIGAVCFYEVDGKEYLHVPSWSQHQHPNRPVESKLPPCPLTDHSLTAHAQRSEPAVSAPARLTPVVGVGEVVGDGEGESAREEQRADVERICDHLADRIEANGSKRPNITPRWRTAARLLLDADHRTEQQVIAAIDWSQADDFWRANILSMPKLRDKYDQLRLAAQRGSPNGNGRGALATQLTAEYYPEDPDDPAWKL